MPVNAFVDAGRLAEVCRRHRVQKLELFGSRAKGTARADSDVDLLVTFEPGYVPGLEFFGMADDFAAVFGHPVDLLTRDSVEGLPNRFKRESILGTAQPIYVSAA